jgi:DNA-directed RNA polymerase alpha subunit
VLDLWDIDIGMRAINCLEKAEIFTLHQLLSMSCDELLSIPGLGKATLKEIQCIKKQLPESMKWKIEQIKKQLEKIGTEIQKLQASEAILLEDLKFARSIIDD